MEDFANDVLSSPVMAFYYWNNGGGGTDSRISPLSYYGPVLYPNTAQVRFVLVKLFIYVS